MDIPADICNTLDLLAECDDAKLRYYAYRILTSKLERHGMRWEWFVS